MKQNSAAEMSFKEQEHMAMVSALHHVICGGTESEGTPFPVSRGTCGINVETDGAVYSVPTTSFSWRSNETDSTSSSGAQSKVTRKYIGVRKRQSGNWAAEIRNPSTGKGMWIGTFGTAEEAARARDLKAIEFHKEKAKTNFPLSDYSEILQLQKRDDDNDQVNIADRRKGVSEISSTSASIENEMEVGPGTMAGIGAMERGESNSGIVEIEDDENGYNWLFDKDEEYGLLQCKIIIINPYQS